MRKFIKVTAFILLTGSFLFEGSLPAFADSGRVNPSYVYGRQSDATLPAALISYNKHNEKCVKYCSSGISAVDLFSKTLRFSIYSANNLSNEYWQHKSLFYQNCLLQL